MTLPTDYWTLVPASNGTLYSGYPAGNPPQPSWSAIPNVLNRSTSYSVNVKTTYLTPTSGPTVTVNGSLPTGWAFDGTTLTYNGTSVAGPNTVSLRASYLGNTVDSNSFSLQGVGSATADVTAPTIPLGLSVIANTSSSVTIGGYTPSDPSPSGATWSGLSQVNVKRTPPGSVIGHTTVGPGTQPIWTLTDIGTAAVATTMSQSGSDLTITTVAVDNPYPTSSSVGGGAFQVTGTSWVLSCRIDAFTTANGFDNVRLEARPTTGATAAYVATLCQPFAQGFGFVSEYRASTGGNSTQVQTAANSTAPAWIFLVRSNDTYSYYYSLDGNTLVSLGSQTQVMGSTLYVVAGANTNAGVSITVTLKQVSLQSLANWTYVDSTVAAATAYTYAASSQDGIPNVSSVGNTISLTTPAVVSSPVFPQLSAYLIGGTTSLFTGATLQTYMKHMNTVIYGCFDGWEAYVGSTMAAFTNTVKAGSLQAGGTKLLAYYDHVYISNAAAVPQMTANQFLLYNKYTSDLTPVTSGGGNIGDICTNNSPVVAGRNSAQWAADYTYDYQANGGGLGLAVNTVAANPNMSGFSLDDFNCYTAYSGDWIRNNTTQGGVNDSTTAQSLAFRQGWATLANRLRSDKSGAIVIANLTGMYANPLTTGISGVFDGGYYEHAIGWVYSEDVNSGWPAMMATIARQSAMCNATQHMIFMHLNLTDDGRDYYRTTAYQGLRYGLGCALLAGWKYNVCPTGSTPNTSLTNVFSNSEYDVQNYGSGQCFDEFSVNPTTLIAYAYGDANWSLGAGWMGTEIDTGIVTAAWQNGMIRKRYQMTGGREAWLIFNPPGNGTQTATYGRRMMAFTGTQAPGVNSGNNNITSESIPASDSRIRITYP